MNKTSTGSCTLWHIGKEHKANATKTNLAKEPQFLPTHNRNSTKIVISKNFILTSILKINNKLGMNKSYPAYKYQTDDKRN